MDGLIIFTGIVITVFGILQIILFFKIWGMTNDVKQIKNKYLSEKRNITQKAIANFSVGSIVTERKTGRKVSISEINPDGTYKCYADGGICIGNLKEEELSY
ncbi:MULTISPECIES: hypothetical protein [Butyricimonas]|uniref:hypothetical protein n=1 Tax=Butyricimonas TaxID=574697 RepID=UPI0007FB31A9|nr:MULTISPECIES: hypothetical protein [Butyricimonas]